MPTYKNTSDGTRITQNGHRLESGEVKEIPASEARHFVEKGDFEVVDQDEEGTGQQDDGGDDGEDAIVDLEDVYELPREELEGLDYSTLQRVASEDDSLEDVNGNSSKDDIIDAIAGPGDDGEE